MKAIIVKPRVNRVPLLKHGVHVVKYPDGHIERIDLCPCHPFFKNEPTPLDD